jgi:hypothetical protein
MIGIQHDEQKINYKNTTKQYKKHYYNHTTDHFKNTTKCLRVEDVSGKAL